MDILQIALIVLVFAGIWAVAELALTLRRTRSAVDSLDKTVADLNNTLAEAQPIVAKLDGAVDELQPALTKVEPLMSSAQQTVDALTSTIVEVESVVRDVSTVTGAAASAGNAVSSISDTASEAVQKLLGKNKAAVSALERTLLAESDVDEQAGSDFEGASEPQSPSKPSYYTYSSDDSSSEATDE